MEDQRQTTVRLLSASVFFRELKPSSRNELAAISVRRRLSKKEILFHEGERGGAFYLMVSGQIRLFKTTEDGHETVIRLIGPGEIFAEVVLFETECYPVTAMAVEASEVLALPRMDIQRLLAEETFRRDFIVMLLQKQRYLTEQIQRLTAMDLESRFFLFLRDQYGTGDTLRIPHSKKEVAAAIGATPESLSRLILRLKKEKRLDWTGHVIRLTPPEVKKQRPPKAFPTVGKTPSKTSNDWKNGVKKFQ